MPGEPAALTGWGRTAPSTARVVAAHDRDTVAKVLSEPPARGVIARGLGRSYNDAAQNAGGTVLDLTPARGVLAADDAAGLVTVGAGTTIDDLIRTFLPRGLFPPVTPGTRAVTIGGAIASDVHGKNHHVDGSFAGFVRRLALWAPATGAVELAPDGPDADAFWATAGGMGLTGVVLDATIALRRVETSRMVVDTDRAGDLDAVLALMAGDDAYPYSVAWIDCQARGRHLGRSVLTRGRHASLADLPAGARSDPLARGRRPTVAAPPWVPSGLVNGLTVRAFNEAWFRHAPRRERGRLVSYEPFFYPLDGIRGWNRLYGRRGFVQYQFVVPFGAEDALRAALEELSASNAASFLAVLKRFGPAGRGLLSFPAEGWTLALDLPVGRPQLGPLLDGLDARVVEAGGRCYLAKDARLRPDLVARMYPGLDRWREVQRRLDPDGVLVSDLSRRLDLLARGRPA